MSLKGGKLIWFNKKKKLNEVIKLKNKKTFKFGYYVTNDFILENPKAKSVQCEIVADAFNRISIINNSRQNPILLNGFPVKTRRPLMHGNKIKIFDEEFVWQFPKNGKYKAVVEGIDKTKECEVNTPPKFQNEGLPAPSSEPWKLKNKRRNKERISAHSLMQRTENASTDESDSEDKILDANTAKNKKIIHKVEKRQSKITHSIVKNDLTKQLKRRRTFDFVTPLKEVNANDSLIKFDVTLKNNKENTPSNRINLCKLSETLITSFSPQVQNNQQCNSSFAYIKSNKNSPKSVYATPKSVLSEINNENDMSSDLIKFSTPTAKYTINNASMYLIDLITPKQCSINLPKTPLSNKIPLKSPILKSALKNNSTTDFVSKSTKKVKMACDYNLENEQSPYDKKRTTLSRTKNSSTSTNDYENQNSLCSIETVEDTINLNNISLTQGAIESSVIEVSDESISSNLSKTQISGKNQSTTSKIIRTPQRSKTPQSLMKKAILSSANKIIRNPSTSTPITSKKLSVSLSKNGRFSDNYGTKLLKRNDTPKLLENVLETNSFSKTSNNGRNSITNSNFQSITNILKTPKRHSCDNTRLAKSLIKQRDTKKASIINSSNKLTCLNKSNVNSKLTNCGEHISSISNIENTKENPQEKVDNGSENSLNQTFTIDSDVDENFETQQSTEHSLSKQNNSNKINISSNSEGIHVIFKTSEQMSNSPNLRNLKSLSKPPNKDSSNVDFSGIKELLTTPKQNASSQFKNIKDRIKTPKINVQSFGNTTELLDSSKNILFEDEEVNRAFKTPSAKTIMVFDIVDQSTSIKKSLNSNNTDILRRTEFNLGDQINIDNFEPLFGNSLQNLENDYILTPRSKFEEEFDKLAGRSTILKVYSNKKSIPKTEKTCTFNLNKTNSLVKADIQEWIESIPSSNRYDNNNSKEMFTKTKTIMNLSGIDTLNTTFESKDSEYFPINECNESINENIENKPADNKSVFHYTQTEIEQTFESFEDESKVKGQKSFTPEISKSKKMSTRKTMGNNQVLEESFDVQRAKEQREIELAFENFEHEPKIKGKKSFTPEISKSKKMSTRKTMGNNQVVDESFDVQAAKEQREMELAFENFEDEPKIKGPKSFTPEVSKSKKINTRKTMGNNQNFDESFDVQGAKEQREIELAFENFENEPKVNGQKSFTPEVSKSKKINTRKTMGNNQNFDESFDVQGAKEQREIELAFENFENEPKVNGQKSFTPEVSKSKKINKRKTMGNNQNFDELFDVQGAKEQREMELAFENFEKEPKVNGQKSFTPEVSKSKKINTRKTMGNNQNFDESFDVQGAKEQREIELVFENFENEPKVNGQKSFTPEVSKSKKINTRKTMGNNQNFDESFDVQGAKEQREMELAFENFEKEPKVNGQKSFTPEVSKSKKINTRKTMGNNQNFDESFDVQGAKEQREIELVFENFENEPKVNGQKSFTPEVSKSKKINTRKTMGNNQNFDESFDVQGAKEQREMELAFENFENEPKVNGQKSFTPEVSKSKKINTRKTMGNNQNFDESFDVQGAKEQREMELAFENFENEPKVNGQKSFTPEVSKSKKINTRKTMGNNQNFDESFDVQGAKEQREMELAFENFENEPKVNGQKSFTPEVSKSKKINTRKTMGNNQNFDESFDVQGAKEQREIELVFENFENEPKVNGQKSFTPEVSKSKKINTRKTMGNNQNFDESFDVQGAKEQREMELAFENFENEPKVNGQKSFTPEVSKSKKINTRKTMGNNQNFDESFDVQGAKEQREIELAFENFEKEPKIKGQKSFTPEVSKSKKINTRKTMGNNQNFDESFDVQGAKEQREIELAFENFENEPKVNGQKSFTPEVSKSKKINTRKTMGNNQNFDESFDVQGAKEQREMELAFENFENEPKIKGQKSFTPEVSKSKKMSTRKTMGNNHNFDESFDVQGAKEQREIELAFENFEKEPKIKGQKSFTPEVSKSKKINTRKTMGNNQNFDESFDVQGEKEQREIELAFENFENEPKVNGQKSFTPEVSKSKKINTRKTMGNNQNFDESFDVQGAKEQREMELAFENFENEPKIKGQKSFTPEVSKSKKINTRKTMGNNQNFDESFDVQGAKEQREMELAFENFENEPKIKGQKSFTPEVSKSKKMSTRKTMGNNQVLEESFDVQAAKEQREMELAFENFEDEPKIKGQKSFTPEIPKSKKINTRKTMGNNQNFDESFDVQGAKEQREMELAFENFENEPKIKGQKSFTPEISKSKKINTRKTMGNNQNFDESFDVQGAKEQREMELAFENYEDEPKIKGQKSFTPEISKSKKINTRKTMGNNQNFDESFDVQGAKEQREMELAFENFENEPKINGQKSFTPEVSKSKKMSTRKTMGNNQNFDESFDVQGAKEQREMELAFENFKNEPKKKGQKSFTPEVSKSKKINTRKTIGNNQNFDESFDVQGAKEQREMELAFENFEDEPAINGQKSFTPEISKSKKVSSRKAIGNNKVLNKSFDLQELCLQRETTNTRLTNLLNETKILKTIRFCNDEGKEINNVVNDLREPQAEVGKENIFSEKSAEIGYPKMTRSRVKVKKNEKRVKSIGEKRLQKEADSKSQDLTFYNKVEKTDISSSDDVITTESMSLDKNILKDKNINTRSKRTKRILQKEIKTSNNMVKITENVLEEHGENSYHKLVNVSIQIKDSSVQQQYENLNSVAKEILVENIDIETNQVQKLNKSLESAKNPQSEIEFSSNDEQSRVGKFKRMRVNKRLKKSDISGTIDATGNSRADDRVTRNRKIQNENHKKNISPIQQKKNDEFLQDFNLNDFNTLQINKETDEINFIKQSSLNEKRKKERKQKDIKNIKNYENEREDLIPEDNASTTDLDVDKSTISRLTRGKRLKKNQNLDHIDNAVLENTSEDIIQIDSREESKTTETKNIIENSLQKTRSTRARAKAKNTENILSAQAEERQNENTETVSSINSEIPKSNVDSACITNETSFVNPINEDVVEIDATADTLNNVEESKQKVNKILPKTRARRVRKANEIDTNTVNDLYPSDSIKQSQQNNESDSDLNKTPVKTRGRGRAKIIDRELLKNINVAQKKEPETCKKVTLNISPHNINLSQQNTESDSDKTPIKTRGSRRRKAVLNEVETKNTEINILKEAEIQKTIIPNTLHNDVEESEPNFESESNVNKTSPKTRGRRGGKQKTNDSNINKITPMKEPEFKTPSSVAPKVRGTRRLRSNSTSTPTTSASEEINQSIEKVTPNYIPRRRLRSNSIQIDEFLLSSDNETEKNESNVNRNKNSPRNTALVENDEIMKEIVCDSRSEPIKRTRIKRGKNNTDKSEDSIEIKEEKIEPKTLIESKLKNKNNKRKLKVEETSNDSDTDTKYIVKRSTRQRK